MSHGIKKYDRGIVKGKTWHNLSQYKQQDEAVSLEDALSLFDYEETIKLVPNFVHIPNDNGEKDFVEAGTRSIVRTDYSQVLNGGVKSRYTLVDMRDITKLAYGQICEAYTDENKKIEIESAGTLDNGAIQFLSIVFDKFKVHGDDSETLNRLMVTNDYAGGGVKNLISQVRVVCKNTRGFAIQQAKDSGNYKVTKHTKEVNQLVKLAMIDMGQIANQMHDEKIKLDHLSQIQYIGDSKIKEVLDTVFPIKNEKGSRNKNKRDEILTLFNEGQEGLDGKYSKTPYAFYNSITNILGNEVGRNGSSSDWDNITGYRAKIKEQALSKILELA